MVYATQNRKMADYALGFLGWLLLNGIMFALLIGTAALLSHGDASLPRNISAADLFLACYALPLALDAVLFYQAFSKRRCVACGALVVMSAATGFTIAIVASIVWSYQVSGY